MKGKTCVKRSGKIQGKEAYFRLLLLLCLLICTAMVIIAIFRGTSYTFHSDDATAVLLAREQLETGTLIPAEWYYGSEYWILSLNLLVIPFLKLTGQMLLSRELAVVLQLLLAEGIFYCFIKKVAEGKWAILGTVLMIAPLSSLQMEHFYFQATYMTMIALGVLVLSLTFEFFKKGWGKRKIFLGGGMSVLILALGCGGVRTLGTVLLPMCGGIAWAVISDEAFDVKRIVKEKEFLIKIFVLGAACIGSYLACLALNTLGQTQKEQEMLLCDSSKFIENLSLFVTSFFQTYGCFEAKTLMSSSGINSFLKLLVAVFCGIIVPVTLAVRFKRLKDGQRVFLGYSLLSSLVIFYMMVFCDLVNSYYYLPVYANNVVLTCIFIEHFGEKIYRPLIVSGFMVVALLSSLFYAKHNYSLTNKWAGFDTVDRGLLNFLREEGLEYGYAEYFNSLSYTILSNGEVEILSVENDITWSEEEQKMMVCLTDPGHVKKWLNSQRWYEEEYHQGESFVLTRTEFIDLLKPEYIERADRVLSYEDWAILVYPYSLSHWSWE